MRNETRSLIPISKIQNNVEFKNIFVNVLFNIQPRSKQLRCSADRFTLFVKQSYAKKFQQQVICKLFLNIFKFAQALGYNIGTKYIFCTVVCRFFDFGVFVAINHLVL